MTTIAERIERVQGAITLYVERFDEQSDEENLTDLFADLMHWAKAHDLDFVDVFNTAEMHFEAEVLEEDEEDENIKA